MSNIEVSIAILANLRTSYDPLKSNLVYICSPFKGNIKGNTKRANRYCKYASDKGFLPIAPHTIFTQFLDEDKPNERELGLSMGITLLLLCKEMWVFGENYSEGMRREIDIATWLDIKIIYHDAIGNVITP